MQVAVFYGCAPQPSSTNPHTTPQSQRSGRFLLSGERRENRAVKYSSLQQNMFSTKPCFSALKRGSKDQRYILTESWLFLFLSRLKKLTRARRSDQLAIIHG